MCGNERPDRIVYLFLFLYYESNVCWKPDKVRGDEAAKQEATQKFAEIGAAYEMLSEEHQNRVNEQQEWERRQQQRSYQHPSHQDPFFGGHSDPFSIFEEVFGNSHSRGGFMNDPFMNDPFFSNHGHGSFGGGMHSSAFSMMDDMMRGIRSQQRMSRSSMQRQHHSPFDSMMGGDPFFSQMGGGNNGQGFSFSSSSSSTTRSSSNRPGERVTQTTRIINGKRQTQTERTIVHPDGREETTVEIDGDDDFPQHAAIDFGGNQGRLAHRKSDANRRRRY